MSKKGAMMRFFEVMGWKASHILCFKLQLNFDSSYPASSLYPFSSLLNLDPFSYIRKLNVSKKTCG